MLDFFIHVMPSHSIVVMAASATDPFSFKISAPISAHSFPLAETAPRSNLFLACACSIELFLIPKL